MINHEITKNTTYKHLTAQTSQERTQYPSLPNPFTDMKQPDRALPPLTCMVSLV